MMEHQALSIEHPVSSIGYRVSSIQNRVSSHAFGLITLRVTSNIPSFAEVSAAGSNKNQEWRIF
jgi:hypothetical protein